MTDTIGFVSKLPTFLVHSFYQTLKEIEHADFIIHVIDASSNYFQEQIEVVRQVLLTLKADSIPSLLLLNKQDLLQKEIFVLSALPTLSFSNRTKLHVKELLDMIVSNIPPSTVRAKFILPYTEGKQSHLLERTAYIYKKSIWITESITMWSCRFTNTFSLNNSTLKIWFPNIKKDGTSTLIMPINKILKSLIPDQNPSVCCINL